MKKTKHKLSKTGKLFTKYMELSLKYRKKALVYLDKWKKEQKNSRKGSK